MDHPVQEKPTYPPRYPSGSTTEVGTPASDPEKDAGARPGTGSRARDLNGDDGSDADSSEHGDVESDEPPAQNVIDRVLSRASTHSINPGPPPNGGYAGWMAVACMHLIVMNSWGLINSFGIFQPYYADLYSKSPSTISWIGSTQVCLLFFVGTFTGRLTDAGYFRAVLFAGTLLQLLGIFSASFATSYVHTLLAQGICMGLANGFFFCPTIATISTYFTTRRALALGIGASGSATGGIVFPLIARFLLPKVGLPWALRTIGFVQLACLSFCNVFLRPRVPPRRSGPIVEWAAFREPQYSFYAAGAFFLIMGILFPFYYLASFATTKVNPPFEYQKSLDLLLVLNVVGAPGRLIPNFLADRFGVMTILVPAAFSAFVLIYSWMGVSSQAGLWVWTAFYGFAGGSIQGLFPAGLSSLTNDPAKQGTRIGMVFTIVSFAALTGSPIGGALVQAMGGRYIGAQAYAGSCCVLGMLLILSARISMARKTPGGWKAKL